MTLDLYTSLPKHTKIQIWFNLRQGHHLQLIVLQLMFFPPIGPSVYTEERRALGSRSEAMLLCGLTLSFQVDDILHCTYFWVRQLLLKKKKVTSHENISRLCINQNCSVVHILKKSINVLWYCCDLEFGSTLCMKVWINVWGAGEWEVNVWVSAWRYSPTTGLVRT